MSLEPGENRLVASGGRYHLNPARPVKEVIVAEGKKLCQRGRPAVLWIPGMQVQGVVEEVRQLQAGLAWHQGQYGTRQHRLVKEDPVQLTRIEELLEPWFAVEAEEVIAPGT